MNMEDAYAVEAERGTSLAEALWRHRWLLVGAALVAGLLGFAASYLQSSEYSASARLILTDPRSAPTAVRVTRDAERYIRNQAEFIETSVVAERASELLGGEPGPQAIENSVSAIGSGNLDLITITAVRSEAQEAADVANAVAQAYQDETATVLNDAIGSAEASLEQNVAQLAAQIGAVDELLAADPENPDLIGQRSTLVAQFAATQSRIEDVKLEVALFGSGVQLYEPAEVPGTATAPRPRRNAAAGAVIGLLAAGALAWWRGEQSPRVASRDVPAAVLGAPLLGVVPDPGREDALTVAAAGSDDREAYDFALSAMDFALDQVGGSVVAVTSPDRGDGATRLVVNLAAAASTDGRRPLLVDADRRRRVLSTLSGDGAGLTELAGDESDLAGCAVTLDLDGAAAGPLSLVPAGHGDSPPAGFFRSSDFKKAVAKIRARGELTLVDVPPVLAAPEAADIVAECDAVVVVVRPGTPVRALEDTRERLRLTGRPVLGYVYGGARRGLPVVGEGADRAPDADVE